jgi:S-DNA-T family DNA segregation ATPase FtsK/SpoIIIE
MISRILKIELFSLFILTILSFTSFYYSEVMPDNFFSISSDSNAVNFLSYYITSFVVMIGYYSGPWIFFPFLFFALFFTFQYSKRESILDVFNIFSLTTSFLLIAYFSVPSVLGVGIRHLLTNFFSGFALVATLIVCCVAFCAGSFRESFKDTVISLINYLADLPSNIKAGYKKVSTNQIGGKLESKRNNLLSSVKTKIPSLLKGDSDESTPLLAQSFKTETPKEQEEVKKTFTPSFVKDSITSLVTKNKDEDSKNIDVDVVEVVDSSNDDTSENAREPKRTYVRGLNRLATENDGKADAEYYDLVNKFASSKTPHKTVHPDDKYFDEIIELIEDKLAEFKIEGKIINVLKGPVVDTFELELGSGVKVSKVTGATEDLSLALYGAPIRIVYPMKGRTTIGIEVPRNPREIIYLDEVLDSEDFKQASQNLPVAMGKNAFGEIFVVDLSTMPHMLVAGATGAGKSVFINALLVSLLIKKSPRQMKLILIDPKQLELAVYSKLPHLIMPVVTDAKTASISLLWAVQEMERRYTILKDFGVRNISGFNEKLKRATPDLLAKIHPLYEDQGCDEYELPYLVIVVDEFADLILTKAGKEIEMNIARLAAKARAAGIHLVLATQRPSVDVITGVIKSNFPTRVSFRVTSNTDSRTILDKMGAEKLLGKGDMLYKAGIETTRVHSSFVDEEEIEALMDKLCDGEINFNSNAMDFLENGGEVETDDFSYGSHISSSHDDKSTDSMYGEALRIVMESRSASASMLQRRLKIGYNRAANLIEELESKGVVGPAQGSKPRQVLMSGDSLTP